MQLISTKEIDLRFSEVDSMGIVWHGSYAQYFEEGREAFGKEYKLGYMDIFGAGYLAPLVSLDIQYKKVLTYPQKIKVETIYMPTDAAKIQFQYKIYNAEGELTTTGSSVQVFLDINRQLILFNPDFYTQWKNRYLNDESL